MPNIVAIIPARGGSKGIPKKNIKILAGKPLIAWTIEEARKSKFLDRIIVSTDDEETAKVAKKYGAEVPFIRPLKLAEDETPMLPVIQHAVNYLEKIENYKPDIIVILQPTSPLRIYKDIDKCIEKLIKERADSCETFSLVKTPPAYMFKIRDGIAFPIDKDNLEKRRQDIHRFYSENGAVFVIKKNVLENNTLYGEKHEAVIIPEERSIDIDNILDFKLAEILLKEVK